MPSSKNEKNNFITHNESIELAPSGDNLLDVTTTPASGVPPPQMRPPPFPGRRNSDTNVEMSYVSSSSDEEEFNDDVGIDAPAGAFSEFDKALRTGKPSRGAASFDTEQSFYKDAADELVKEVMLAEEMGEQPPAPRQQRRAKRLAQQQEIQKQRAASPTLPDNMSYASEGSTAHNSTASFPGSRAGSSVQPLPKELLHEGDAINDDLSSGVLPDVLMTMRQKIESLTLFDSDMIRMAEGRGHGGELDDKMLQETRESLKRSSQQSLSAAVLVSLAHKRYERRRLAAMEIEKVVRSLVVNNKGESLERVRAILLLLSDDYVRSTSEDARKGGVVALAACAIGLKRAPDTIPEVSECRDLILASVVHACQDHSQRVRYYATESLFNVVKVIPHMAVQHFFILFEILRSLYADVDTDVRSGAELLDKKLKEVIVGAINSGSFTAEECVPIFARFVYMRNKATKRLTLTWLQELNEKLIGAPVLDFLHLFLGGIFQMVADPNIGIRQSALAFLQSVLPKLLMDQKDEMFEEDTQLKVDFDKLIQSLVTTLEHPDPFVRKVAMYWVSRIVKAHVSSASGKEETPAGMSVRNSLPHLLPGIFLSIGDTFSQKTSTKDSFLPDQTTQSLAEQTNSCLQDAVRLDGTTYVTHLDGFIVALREELDSPGGLINSRTPPAVERKPYRIDVAADGTGIESAGWYRASSDSKQKGKDSVMMSRLCALQWIVVLYESVVPVVLKADYAREFITPIIHQLVDNPPEQIIYKSLEVLTTITVRAEGEEPMTKTMSSGSLSGLATANVLDRVDYPPEHIMSNESITDALDILESSREQDMSRNREVFSVLIQLHAYNHQLLANLSPVIQYMCTLQPPEFVFVSFAVELDRFVLRRSRNRRAYSSVVNENEKKGDLSGKSFSADLEFVSSFVQQMGHVLLNTKEAHDLRDELKDCVVSRHGNERDQRRARLFHILLQSFSHNLIASLSLCLWAGAFKTASSFLYQVDELDITLIFLMELDKLVEVLERPLFRHMQLRMIQCDKDPRSEGSGGMLFRTLKSLLMIVPQSTCYNVLRERLVTIARFRQTALSVGHWDESKQVDTDTSVFVDRVLEVRKLHCDARWETIRSESLEKIGQNEKAGVEHEEGAQKREWLGYSSKEEETVAQEKYQEEKRKLKSGFSIEEVTESYNDLDSMAVPSGPVKEFVANEKAEQTVPDEDKPNGGGDWKNYWAEEKE